MPNYTGRQFGNYSIIRLLGEGGFAQVYLGEHVYLKTQAAIKVLLGNLQDQDLQNFLNESRMVARLRHPSIVRVLDFGVAHDQTPFLVMTYAPHGTLRQRHQKNPIVPKDMIVSYVQQVAAALDYAHEQRLIHRDVKPENMLLGRNDEVLLSDFGIAVLARSTLSQSKEEITGTLAYMAPEQLKGRPRPASDQYALGIVTYEWFCGVKPFAGSGFYELAVQHLQSPVPSLRKHAPAIPETIDAVVMKALAKAPEERFPTVMDYATALERACASAPSVVMPQRSTFTASPRSITNDTVTATTDGVSYTTAPAKPDTLIELVPKTRPQERLSRRTVTMALTGIVGLGAVGSGITWFTLSHAASPSHPSPTPSRRIGTPTAQPVVSLPNLPVGTTLATYSNHSNFITGLTWSPDGRWIASSSYDKTVHVWSPVANTTYVPLVYKGHTDKVLAVAWSPSGRFVASSGLDTTVRVWYAPTSLNDSKAGSTRVIYRGQTTMVPAIAWSPNSQRLASTSSSTVSSDMPMQVCDAETGKHTTVYYDPVQDFPNPTGPPYNAVAWSPDGLSIVSKIANVSVWNVASGDRIVYSGQSTNQYVVHGLAWSPNSKRIASASDDKTVAVWDATTGNTFFIYKGHTKAVNAVAWSHDGKYLASASSDKTVQVWDATNGKPLFTYKRHTASVNTLVWSPDSRHLASGGDDKQVLVWQAV